MPQTSANAALCKFGRTANSLIFFVLTYHADDRQLYRAISENVHLTNCTMFTLFRFIKQLLLDLYSINHQFLTLPDSFQKALFSTNPALNVNLSWAEMVFYLDFYPYEKFVGIPALVRAYSCAFRFQREHNELFV